MINCNKDRGRISSGKQWAVDLKDLGLSPTVEQSFIEFFFLKNPSRMFRCSFRVFRVKSAVLSFITSFSGSVHLFDGSAAVHVYKSNNSRCHYLKVNERSSEVKTDRAKDEIFRRNL